MSARYSMIFSPVTEELLLFATQQTQQKFVAIVPIVVIITITFFQLLFFHICILIFG